MFQEKCVPSYSAFHLRCPNFERNMPDKICDICSMSYIMLLQKSMSIAGFNNALSLILLLLTDFEMFAPNLFLSARTPRVNQICPHIIVECFSPSSD